MFCCCFLPYGEKVIFNCITQVNGTSVVAEEESFGKKAKISIVINEERYDFGFFSLSGVCQLHVVMSHWLKRHGMRPRSRHVASHNFLWEGRGQENLFVGDNKQIWMQAAAYATLYIVKRWLLKWCAVGVVDDSATLSLGSVSRRRSRLHECTPVSYTHLTLPTKRIV